MLFKRNTDLIRGRMNACLCQAKIWLIKELAVIMPSTVLKINNQLIGLLIIFNRHGCLLTSNMNNQ